MFGDEWFGGPNPAFAGTGPFGPDEPAEPMGGWAPWMRGPRGPKGRGPWGRGPWNDPRNLKWRFGRGFGPGFGSGPNPGFGPDFGPPPFVWRMGRRFPFGPGMGPGPGGFGPGGPAPRMFGRGDLKYALLDLLKERPKHGYEMIKDLEERSGGFYTPSAGAIYPTLQLLEDREWVRAETQEGKKVYTLTDAGRQALTDHERQREERHGHHSHHDERFEGRHEGHHGRHEGHDRGPFGGGPGFGRGRRGFGPFGWQMSPELMDLGRESMDVARLLRSAVMASGGDSERLRRLRAIITHTRGELDEFLGQSRQDAPGSSSQPDQSGEGPRTAGGPEGPVEQV